MISNFFRVRNDFYVINKQMIFNEVSNLSVDKESYSSINSNCRYAVLGN